MFKELYDAGDCSKLFLGGRGGVSTAGTVCALTPSGVMMARKVLPTPESPNDVVDFVKRMRVSVAVRLALATRCELLCHVRMVVCVSLKYDEAVCVVLASTTAHIGSILPWMRRSRTGNASCFRSAPKFCKPHSLKTKYSQFIEEVSVLPHSFNEVTGLRDFDGCSSACGIRIMQRCLDITSHQVTKRP